jgi:primosomal protein N' (replication factor Y) (superfamily II helicase)
VHVYADVLTSANAWNNEQPLLTYSVPPGIQDELQIGQLIAVPYGDRLVEGIVWGIWEDEEAQGEDITGYPHKGHPRKGYPQGVSLHFSQSSENTQNVGNMPSPPETVPLAGVQDGDTQFDGNQVDNDTQFATQTEHHIRPISTILDPEPALLAHQRALAEWMATYYVTPLAQVAVKMLPPGLMQRSKVVLHLINDEEQATHTTHDQQALTRLHALIGLLLADGELDVERLKEMLGPKQAKEILQEALSSGLIEREATLHAPTTHVRHKRVVRLLLRGEALEAWRMQTRTQLEQSLPAPGSVPMAADNVRKRPQKNIPDPWAIPGSSDVFTLTPQNRQGLLAQRRLAAIDLLCFEKHETNIGSYWTAGTLCKASGLTPAQLKKLVHENIIAIEEIEVQRNPLLGRIIPATEPFELTADQQAALEQIVGKQGWGQGDAGQRFTGRGYGEPRTGQAPSQHDMNSETSQYSRGAPLRSPWGGRWDGSQQNGVSGNKKIAPILLHGVTGSGKTEVYLQALAAIIAEGKRGIVLVPEIALTAQAILRFVGRFPDRVAVIHSELTDGERYDEWRRIRSGKVDVVIGSRSALFSPLPDPGIIILDEEHEPAYKQNQPKPTYHARDAAIFLGQILHIPIVLGSATPSVESFFHAARGDYHLTELHQRIGADLPPVEVIDLRNELHAGNTSIFSRRLQSELEQVLQKGQQAILYLNRRGAASCVLCRECGFVAMCDHCDMPLTYHSTERILLCHYCNGQNRILHLCPQCNSPSIRYFGLGTEKVEDTIARHFPSARLLRWDRDTARHRRTHEQLLDRFSNREADILVGTQMIAKGLDLPGVTLVGVISADIALTLPDFSASERAFTLLTQVAGRAGRGEEAGKVIIQTFNPQHFCIEAASKHDYHEFYTAEIEARQRYGYPPFRQFVKFTYSHENRRRAQNEALLLRETLDKWIDRLGLPQTDIVGPAPAVMERIRGKYRWQMIARGPDLHPLLRAIDTSGWEVDIDPVSTM